MNNLPEDCERLIWKKVFDNCLQDMMKEVCVWNHILNNYFDCLCDNEETGEMHPHVYNWEYFDRYYDMKEKYNISDEEIDVIEELRYIPYNFDRLVELIEEDNGILEGISPWEN